MPACPICRVSTDKKWDGSPYFTCANCQTWFQDPMPTKRWHGDHETWVGQPMSDGEKAANKGLAEWLFGKAMDSKPGRVLDVGCGYPILLHYMREHGCDVLGIDGDGLPNDLRIGVRTEDFEAHTDTSEYRHDLIIFVHTWEHVYNPVEAFRKCHKMLEKDGSLFIRMPDHQVNGYERDLTEGHFSIHPMFYCFTSILELCLVTKLFEVTWTGELQPGQRDILLRPL